MTATVLVVDDDDDVRALVEAVLQVSGLRTAGAGGGDAALQWVGEHDPPDAVVLDVQMPGRDGWDTLAALRTAGVDCPVLMCTVKVRDAARAADLGVGFLPKPFAIDDLRNRVVGMLRAGHEEVRS